jgi:hypothetical protein
VTPRTEPVGVGDGDGVAVMAGGGEVPAAMVVAAA